MVLLPHVLEVLDLGRQLLLRCVDHRGRGVAGPAARHVGEWRGREGESSIVERLADARLKQFLTISRYLFSIGAYRANDGTVRLVVPFPTWDDLLRLAFDEICAYGATSVQVMRRMNALVADLKQAVPEERRSSLTYWEARLKATIARSFADGEERMEASEEDRQGLGVPRRRSSFP